jgi:hypothetical protein
MDLAHDCVQWQALVLVILNLWVLLPEIELFRTLMPQIILLDTGFSLRRPWFMFMLMLMG